MTIYTDKPEVKAVGLAAFPTYKGRSFKLLVTDGPINVRSCWDGGSRDYYAFVNLATLEASQTVPTQSTFDKPIAGADSVSLPDGFACVEHSIFCGKDMGLIITVGPKNAANLLPAPIELTSQEKIVLAATAGLKNTYGGRTDIRFTEAASYTGITRQQWLDTQSSLVKHGLLRKNGSITNEGRNAIGNNRLHNLGE